MVIISVIIFIALIINRKVRERKKQAMKRIVDFDKNGRLERTGYYFIQKELGRINSLSK